MTFKLPEPVSQLIIDYDAYWYEPLNELAVLPDGTYKLYTADQMRQYRLDTLEEAAKMCENETEDVPLTLIADAIRALKVFE